MPTPEQIFEANQNGDFETRLQRLEQEWHRAERANSALCLVMMDLDRFKNYNDDFGHPAGDVVLQKVASLPQLVEDFSSLLKDLLSTIPYKKALVLASGNDR